MKNLYWCPVCGITTEISTSEIQQIGDPYCPDCLHNEQREVEMEIVEESELK
jgi:hypothetical protein